ncbi:QRFP-like peptide receptor [Babylonia areolata]|uniref:QRFP-like peptide receptor n=1 Tax=Babylonia areolata TaxID=304850 RepID=UPI003FD2E5F9
MDATTLTSDLVTINVTSATVTAGENVTLVDAYEDYIYDYDASMASLPIAEVVPVSIVYGFTLLFGLGGNSLVILVVLRNERLRSITNIFLTSLATADLVLVSFCVPVKCAAFFSFTWAFGEFLCKAVHYIQAVSMVCSVMTLTVMSIERNIAILFPLRAKYLCTRGHAHIVIAVVWVLSFLMASPVLVGQKHKEVGEAIKAYWCVREWVPPEVGLAFDIYMLVLLFLLPVTIMAAAYTGIARALWKSSNIRRSVVTVTAPRSPALTPSAARSCSWRPRSTEISTSSSSDTQTAVLGSSGPAHHGNNLQRSEVTDPGTKNTYCQRSRLDKEKFKVVKMLIVVVLLFAVCWGPVLINNVLVGAGVLSRLHYGYLKPLRQAFYLLSYLNSCLNPMVYGFMSAHFRASFRQAFFSCCFFRCRMRSSRELMSFRSRTTVISFRAEPGRLQTTSRRKVYLTPTAVDMDTSVSGFVQDSPVDTE